MIETIFLPVLHKMRYLWLALSGIALIAELYGGNGYCLWVGISALLVSSLAWFTPLHTVWLWTIFILLIPMSTCCWFFYQRKRGDGDHVALNPLQQQLVGCQITLLEPLMDGHGRLKIGHTIWPITTDQDLPAGCKVRVVKVEGITLFVVRHL